MSEMREFLLCMYMFLIKDDEEREDDPNKN